jgi:hypothetical protein
MRLLKVYGAVNNIVGNFYKKMFDVTSLNQTIINSVVYYKNALARFKISNLHIIKCFTFAPQSNNLI